MRPSATVIIAGILVGFGTRMGSGCTSGHGVCGLSRRSPRSLVAVAVFMTTGAIAAVLAGGPVPGVRLVRCRRRSGAYRTKSISW